MKKRKPEREKREIVRVERSSRWPPLLFGVAAGTGVTLLIIWLLRHGGSGSGKGQPGTIFAVDRIQFRIDGTGITYEGQPVSGILSAITIASKTRPRVVEIFATGAAIVDTIKKLRDGLVAAGFTVTGNAAVIEA